MVASRSPLFGYDIDYTSYLGGEVRNSTGAVVKASTILDFWVTGKHTQIARVGEKSI